MLNHRLLLLFPSVTALATDRRQVVSKSSLFSSPTTTTNQSFTIQTSLPNNSSSISTTSRGDSSRTIATTAVTANVAAASASPVLGQRAVHGLPVNGTQKNGIYFGLLPDWTRENPSQVNEALGVPIALIGDYVHISDSPYNPILAQGLLAQFRALYIHYFGVGALISNLYIEYVGYPARSVPARTPSQRDEAAANSKAWFRQQATSVATQEMGTQLHRLNWKFYGF